MTFCTNCGEPTNANFCEKCGAPVSAAVVPAPASATVAQPRPIGPATLQPGVKKPTSPLVWILGGLAVFFVLIVILFVGAGLFVAKKVTDSGVDTALLQRNPVLAAARMAVALNPDVEVVDTDEDKGVLTIREKSTGKTITMNAEDIKNGKLSFSDDATGEKLSIGVDHAAKLPEWVPAYPGSKPEGTFSATAGDGEGEGGMAHFKTSDAGPKVLAYYQDALKKAGYKITATMSGAGGEGAGGMIAAENSATKKSVMVTLSSSSEGTDVAVTYGRKR